MKRGAILFLQTALIALGLGAAGLLLWEPRLEGVNAGASTLYQIYFDDPFLMFVYAGSIPFFIALYQAIKVLGFTGQNKVFSPEAVRSLRTIKYCALAIIGFVVAEETYIILTNNLDSDNPGAPIFMGLLITFGSIVVATAAALFERVLQNAIELKSENDLTV